MNRESKSLMIGLIHFFLLNSYCLATPGGDGFEHIEKNQGESPCRRSESALPKIPVLACNLNDFSLEVALEEDQI